MCVNNVGDVSVLLLVSNVNICSTHFLMLLNVYKSLFLRYAPGWYVPVSDKMLKFGVIGMTV